VNDAFFGSAANSFSEIRFSSFVARYPACFRSVEFSHSLSITLLLLVCLFDCCFFGAGSSVPVALVDNRPFRIGYAPAVPLPIATIASNSILPALFFQCLILVSNFALGFMCLGTFHGFWCHLCSSTMLPINGCFVSFAPSSPLTTFMYCHNLPVLSQPSCIVFNVQATGNAVDYWFWFFGGGERQGMTMDYGR